MTKQALPMTGDRQIAKELLLRQKITEVLQIIGYDPVARTTGFHPDNDGDDYMGLLVSQAVRYDGLMGASRELAWELRKDLAQEALRILEDLSDSYERQRQEALALAVSIANLLVTGKQLRDPQLLRDALANLDITFGSLVDPSKS